VLYRTAFHVCARIERTNRPPRDQAGWLQRDSLAPALLPVLRAMVDEDDVFDETDLDANYVDSKGERLARREGFEPPTLRFEDRPKR
jgi:hypothetical protein